MRLHVEPDPSGLACRAANIVAAAISALPGIVLALPTGRTPLGMYDELVRMHRLQSLDFSRVRIFSLDEYRGLDIRDARSFHSYLWTHLLEHVNVSRDNVHLPSPTADDAACQAYEDEIRAAGGIDLLVAGVGSNGHIAFNEPGSALDSRTRIVDLANSTLDHMRPVFQPDPPPHQAVTIGIATILEARRILLLAAGEAKREALQEALAGPVSVANPVSALRLHSDVTVVADRAAAFPQKDSRI